MFALRPDDDAPLALARLHWSTPVGHRIEIELDEDGDAVGLDDLVIGAGFELISQRGSRATLERLRTLPDTVGPGMRLLVCGLNPSVVSADAGYGYASPTNRFWPAAVDAGLVTAPRGPVHALTVDGVGMTDLVKRATPAAGALSAGEYRAGAGRVERMVAWLRPGAVVFVGLAGWRAAIDRRAVPGWQPDGLGGVPSYLMPSTSGLNAHSSRAVLAGHLGRALAGNEAR